MSISCRAALPHTRHAADRGGRSVSQCDKLTVDGRKYCQLTISDDGSVCRAERPFYFCRAKLTIRCDNRHGVETANIVLMPEFQT